MSKDKDFISPIKRDKNKNQEKNYAKREPINAKDLNSFNLFSDDESEHSDKKLKPEEKGAWKVKGRPKAKLAVPVVCGQCGDEFEVHPSLYKQSERNDDGTLFNRNVCDDCIRKRRRR